MMEPRFVWYRVETGGAAHKAAARMPGPLTRRSRVALPALLSASAYLALRAQESVSFVAECLPSISRIVRPWCDPLPGSPIQIARSATILPFFSECNQPHGFIPVQN